MRRFFYLIWAVFFTASLSVLTGCEKDPEQSTKSGGADAESDTSGTTDPNFNGSSVQVTNNDEIPNVPAVPVCTRTCENATDCVAPFEARPLYQVENYRCDQGICIHLGCTSDANCKEAYSAFDYVCSPKGECVDQCETAADCVLWDEYPDLDDAMDENNFECVDGACLPIGCLSSAECVISNGTTYVCSPVSGSGINTCHLKCDSENGDVSACVTSQDNPSMDADNYECEVETCVYKGCRSDDECADGAICVDQH